MFKKFLVVLVALFGVFTLTSCNRRTYMADGEFIAFKESLNYGAPQITVVKVTIENDEIKSFYIDCLQSTAVKDESNTVTSYAFNAKTKKELRYDYRMHDGGRTMSEEDYIAWLKANNKLEWFEQAELLEAYFLANGTDLQTDDQGHITNVASVTIADSDYSLLAKQAVENAKQGKVYSWLAYSEGTSIGIIWAEGTLKSDGTLKTLKLDELQGKMSNGTFSWNAKTKQELKYDYRMHDGGRTMSEEDYKKYLKDNNKLEWFEQADLLANYALKNGVSGLTLDGTKLSSNKPQALAGVSINVNHYIQVLGDLLNTWK